MALVFGEKKKDAAEDTHDGMYLRNFKDGETSVRFLEEVQEWFKFKEHYTADRKSFPCTRDAATCPGCTSGNEEVARASTKYATNLYNVKGKFTAPYRIPASLAERMVVRSERNGGTVLNRDYAVIRSGKGFDTEYDVDQEDKYAVDVAEKMKEATDVQEVLLAMYNAANSPEAGREREAIAAHKEREAKQEEDPPSESSSSTKGDDEEFSESQIRDMSRSELGGLFRKAGIEIDEDDSRTEMVEKLLTKFGAQR